MKEIFKLILLLVILSGCIENDEEIILNNSDLEDVSEYKRAEDLICQFSERIDKEKGGTRSSTSQIILSLAGKKSVVIPKIATRTGEISTDSVNMFIFDTEKDGRFGFAIATGKAEVGRVYAYVENGIANQADLDAVKVEQLNTKQKRVDLDTIENEGMAYLVSQIPDIIKQDQLNPNLTRSGEQRTTHVSIPLVKTEWNQHYPYNAQMPTNGKCSISYYYAGCIPIAVAQAITYYRKCPVAYDWDAFTVNTGIYDANLIAPVSQFVKKVADGIKVGYKCDGTGAKNLGSTNDFLKGWGYNVERHKTNDVDKNLLYKCLITKNVVIFGGKKKKSTGHVWLVDGGVFEYSGNMMIGCTNIQVKAIHCNFGWNRANNGWYAIKDGAYNRPANSASQDGNNPTNDKNSPNGNFYTENDYIYFHEAMGTEILW